MKRDELYWKAFKMSFGWTMMFVWFTLLPAMMFWKADTPSVLQAFVSCAPWAALISIPALLWAGMETELSLVMAHGDENLRVENLQLQINHAWTFLLWCNPVGWLGLFFIWQLRKSPGACLTCVALLSIIKKID